MQINDLFGAAAAFETVRMPDGTEAAIPTEHAAVIYVNEQPAFRVVCTPQLLPQLALGRLLTEGWIASAEEVEQISVCAEGLKVNIYLNHPLTSTRGGTGSFQLLHRQCRAGQSGGSAAAAHGAASGRTAGVGGCPRRRHERGPSALSGHSCSPQLLCAARGPHPLCLRGHRTPQCAGQGRGQHASGRCPLSECVLYTSGRVPMDMVRKAIRAGVPALVSKTMPTVQSLELAAEYGLQFVCGRKHPLTLKERTK